MCCSVAFDVLVMFSLRRLVGFVYYSWVDSLFTVLFNVCIYSVTKRCLSRLYFLNGSNPWGRAKKNLGLLIFNCSVVVSDGLLIPFDVLLIFWQFWGVHSWCCLYYFYTRVLLVIRTSQRISSLNRRNPWSRAKNNPGRFCFCFVLWFMMFSRNCNRSVISSISCNRHVFDVMVMFWVIRRRGLIFTLYVSIFASFQWSEQVSGSAP